jgi:hypothetical protein
MNHNEFISQQINELLKQQEMILIDQLNELISRDLLVVESHQPVLTRSEDSGQVQLRQTVKLKLKDQEYIEKLEKENKTLKERINAIENAINKLGGPYANTKC